MNIGSANLVPSLSAQSVSEGVSPALTNAEYPADFADAFIEQIKLSNAGNSQVELLNPIQPGADPAILNELQNLAGLFGEGGDMQKLAAFFGKELPMSYKVSAEADPEATLSVLDNTLTTSDETNIFNIKAIATENQSDGSEMMAVIEEQNNLYSNELPLSGSVDVNKMEIDSGTNRDDSDLESTEALAGALLASLLAPAMAATGQNTAPAGSTEVTAVKQASPAMLKNPNQTNRLTPTRADIDTGTDNFLLQLAGASESQDGKAAAELNFFEKAALSEKNGQLGKDSLSGGEKNLLKGVAEMNLLNRQTVELRTEIPALAKPITHPDWNKELGERILWMNNRSISAAEIKLNPQHLGPVSVRVDVNQDQATISFAAQHSTVREALEASIPKLRDMMGAQQLNLIDVNVSQHFSSDQGRSQFQSFAQTASSQGSNVDGVVTEATEEINHEQAVMTKGLLSIYA